MQYKQLYMFNISPNCDMEYILDALKTVAHISKIALLPYTSIVDGLQYLEAYITVKYWYKNHFSKALLYLLDNPPQSPNHNVYLYHNKNMGWPIKAIINNTNQNIKNTSKICNTSNIGNRKSAVDDIWLEMTHDMSSKCAEFVLDVD